MSQENVEIAREAFDAVGRGDLDGFLALIDPGVEFTSLITEADRRSYSGHDGVRDWFTEVRQTFEDFEAGPEEIREVGDRLIVRLRVRGTVAGVRIEQAMWQAVRLRDQRIASWDVFRTEGEALEAVGWSSAILRGRCRRRTWRSPGGRCPRGRRPPLDG
ncbi:MAG: nuclear transport factor 2 family protein [Thermoleophilaceae bacterium]|nr:nuclear transport factor 2 family protein [Thermoleophilaceae bacterium]